ncbi:DUF2889 domain-containing protein [Rhodopila globiformis]|uniref:DUF2889 domain-containing protein n=1 Tax=Rhodopila globiformis TaxID=1071 RepID=A0A2S6MW63_RHOGL|nr:DUF2889 domain-containing protein [Rhodopila globiformis]PPQ26615.1 hypothetical protein CCS01_30135 [Rhodopila globiformis]
MPLSQPADRERLHTRAIEINGYRRHDGLYDIEAHLTDCKSYGLANVDRGTIEPGEPLHDLWIRVTVDESMHILSVEAVSDRTPYTTCPDAAPNFARLVGLQIKGGFVREANKLVGGVIGCTHLRELLQQVATTAFQTINPSKARRELQAEGEHPNRQGSDALDKRITEKWGGGMRILNTCLAYDEKGPLVRRRWPDLYIGPDRMPAESEGVGSGAPEVGRG